MRRILLSFSCHDTQSEAKLRNYLVLASLPAAATVGTFLPFTSNASADGFDAMSYQESALRALLVGSGGTHSAYADALYWSEAASAITRVSVNTNGVYYEASAIAQGGMFSFNDIDFNVGIDALKAKTNTSADLDFRKSIWWSFDGVGISEVKWFTGNAESRLVSADATGAVATQSSNFVLEGGTDNGLQVGYGFDLDGYIGFSMTTSSGTEINGFVDYEYQVVDFGYELFMRSWAYNIDESVTMPGTTPVPGLGGLAALACGAAGVRRKRHRPV